MNYKSRRYFIIIPLLLFFIFSLKTANASVDIVPLATQTTSNNPFSITVGPNNTIVTIGYDCGCLTIHNVANKSAPVQIYSTSTNAQPGFITGSGNYVYIGTYNGKLETWNLSSTTAPVRTNTYSLGGAYGIGKMRIVDGFLYVSTYQGGFVGPGGIQIFDLASSSAPSFVSNTSFSVNHSGVGDVLAIGNYMYAADYFGKTVKVYDISNKASPQLRQSFAARDEPVLDWRGAGWFEPWRLMNKGNALYISDDNIIQIYDMSSSTNIVYATTTVVAGDAEGITLRNNLIYVSGSGVQGESYKKIQIFNISDPFAPVLVAERYNGLNNYWTVVDDNGYFYTAVAATDQYVIYSPIEPPVISVSAPTNVASTTITLNASVTNNNNASSTDRGFNYGATTAYGSTASTTGTFNIGAFSQNLTGLTCNTLYHYQAFAINTAGTATSSDQTFTTASCPPVIVVPTLTTSSPTSVSTTTITLNGDITSDGNASSTDRGFNYGATTAYGSTASTTGTFGISSFSQDLTGLTCNTLYHYRSFAINSAGTGSSTDATFTTDACPVAPVVTQITSGSSGSGGSVSSQISNLIAIGNYQLAQQLANQYGLNTPVSTVFARSLTLGHNGGDVQALQKYLNTKGFIVSKTGAGSKGNETMVFGTLTRQALARFQKANKIYPAIGFFGPLTRAFVAKNP